MPPGGPDHPLPDIRRVHIEIDDLSREPVRALLADHLGDMHATSPPESVHRAGPRRADRCRRHRVDPLGRPTVLGCAALMGLPGGDAGAVESMRTATAARGRGVATRLLEHLLAEARGRYARYGDADPNSAYLTPAL